MQVTDRTQSTADVAEADLSPEQALRAELELTIGRIVEDHPGPDSQDLAADIVSGVIDRLRLHVSKVFLDKSDRARPIQEFRVISGRLDVGERG